jgi:hypothetical protein
MAAVDLADDDAAVLGRNALANDFPGVRLHQVNGQLLRVSGIRMGSASTPEVAAATFVNAYSTAFGVAAKDLVAGNARDMSVITVPVMLDRAAGTKKFDLVYYSHIVDGVPVFRSEIRVLTLNDGSNSVVWAGSSLRDLKGFAPTAVSADAASLGKATAAASAPGLVNFTDGRTVIFAGADLNVTSPRMAVEFVGDNGLAATGEYKKVLFVTDAATGQILHRESLILNADVTGNVNGMATTGVGADTCDPEALANMPYARVAQQSTSNFVYANVLGNYVFSAGTTSITLESALRGNFFRTFNQGGASTVLTQTVTPPAVANFTHNAANTSEFNRAEVNAYLQANVVRDFTLFYSPGYPVITTQTEFTTNVNIASTCNAFYDGVSINFYRSGGGCTNTANSTVVHHEYGHHLVASAGSLQGAYGEGMGDSMGVLITDQPDLGIGFQSCSSPLRTANNTKQYPCSGEIHDCGQLISGCIWSTRNELVATNPGTYHDIISDLAVNAMLLHVGSDTIAPDITTDYLTLDDDNGDLSDGTPHSVEILAGFGAHNMVPDTSPVGCSDVRNFRVKCQRGKFGAQVKLDGLDDDGKIVVIRVDGVDFNVTVNGDKATYIDPAGGTHTAELVDPAGCGFPPGTISCFE